MAEDTATTPGLHVYWSPTEGRVLQQSATSFGYVLLVGHTEVRELPADAVRLDTASAELDRMRPIVEAAQEWKAWRDKHPTPERFTHPTNRALQSAVDAYQGVAPTTPSETEGGGPVDLDAMYRTGTEESLRLAEVSRELLSRRAASPRVEVPWLDRGEITGTDGRRQSAHGCLLCGALVTFWDMETHERWHQGA